MRTGPKRRLDCLSAFQIRWTVIAPPDTNRAAEVLHRRGFIRGSGGYWYYPAPVERCVQKLRGLRSLRNVMVTEITDAQWGRSIPPTKRQLTTAKPLATLLA